MEQSNLGKRYDHVLFTSEGPGEANYEKKPEVKKFATLSLSAIYHYDGARVEKRVKLISHEPLFYILTRGGLIDKPGKSSDYYHTCYTLSGLSVAQHFTCHKTHSTLVLGDKRSVSTELTSSIFRGYLSSRVVDPGMICF
jgi:hypothetical protein